MLVRSGSPSLHQVPPQKRDIATGSRFEQARIVFGGDALPLVPPVNNHDRLTDVVRQRLAGRPHIEDGQNGVCVGHASTK